MELELYEALTAINVPPDKAKAVADAWRHEQESHLATKDDLRATTAELRAEIAELRAELRTTAAALRAEMAELRTELRTTAAELRTEIEKLRGEMHAMFATQTKWLCGAIFVANGLTVALIKLLP